LLLKNSNPDDFFYYNLAIIAILLIISYFVFLEYGCILKLFEFSLLAIENYDLLLLSV